VKRVGDSLRNAGYCLILAWLNAREDFVAYRRRESFKSCIRIYLSIPIALQTKGMISVLNIKVLGADFFKLPKTYIT
jgi:hypothetical protein